MKTIRKSVFETNSSSTHSVTLYDINKKGKKIRPLVEDGMLYPERLQDYELEYGSEVDMYIADDKDKKAAWILNAFKHSIEDEDDCELDLGEVYAEMCKLICESCGYTSISSAELDFYNLVSDHSEIGESFSSITSSESFSEAIKVFKKDILKDIILKDSVGICEGMYPMHGDDY